MVISISPSLLASLAASTGTTASPTTTTVSPTMLPTVSPTMLPTVSPTMLPTVSPTMLPTVSPTALPTVLPTMLSASSLAGTPLANLISSTSLPQPTAVTQTAPTSAALTPVTLPPAWKPTNFGAELQPYVDAFEAYRNDMLKKGYYLGPTDPALQAAYMTIGLGPGGGSIHVPGAYDPSAASIFQKAMQSGLTPEQMYDVGRRFYTNTGAAAGLVNVSPTQQIRVVDRAGDGVVYSGTGLSGLDKAYEIASGLSAQGESANWDVQTYDPATGQWSTWAKDRPPDNLLGKVIGGVLPLATLAIPGLNVLTGALVASGLGGAGAAIAGGDPLKGALMGGASSLGGSLLGPALSGATGVSQTVGSAIGTGLGSAGGTLATGGSLQNALTSGLLSGAGSYLGSQLLGGAAGTTQPGEPINLLEGTPYAGSVGGLPSSGGGSSYDGNLITVTGAPTPVSLGNVLAAMAAVNANSGGSSSYNNNEITVTGAEKPVSLNDVLAAMAAVNANYGGSSSYNNNEITVTAQPEAPVTTTPKPVTVEEVLAAMAALGGAGALSSAAGSGAGAGTGSAAGTTTAGGGLLSQLLPANVLSALQAAGLLSTVAGLVGSLTGVGGGGGGGGATLPGSSGPIGQMPNLGLGAIQPYTGNYETYGTRAEHQFFRPLLS